MKNLGILMGIASMMFLAFVTIHLLIGGHFGYSAVFYLMSALAYAGLKAELNELKKNKED